MTRSSTPIWEGDPMPPLEVPGAHPDDAVLAVQRLSAGYGSITVLRDINLRIERKEIVAVLGRNGAGKTTLLKSIMGVVRPGKGRILLDQKVDLAGKASDRVASAGIGYVPQGRAIFPTLTVMENLKVAQYARGNPDSVLEEVIEFLPEIKPQLHARGASLSGGQQQIVALARALVTRPRLLLLDEPSEGIQPSIIDTIIDTLRSAQRKWSLSILLVEQNLDFAALLAQRAYVMELGRVARVLPKEALVEADELARELMITT